MPLEHLWAQMAADRYPPGHSLTIPVCCCSCCDAVHALQHSTSDSTTHMHTQVELMTEAAAGTTRPVSGDASVVVPAAAADAAMLPGLTSGGRLTPHQELVLSNLVRVKAVISQHIAKQEEDRTTDFL